jgi:hypothetical protein
MHDESRLEALLARISPLTDNAKFEMLLLYFNVTIRDMDRPTLVAFRAEQARRHQGAPEQQTILEVIDGLIALRDIEAPGKDVSDAS